MCVTSGCAGGCLCFLFVGATQPRTHAQSPVHGFLYFLFLFFSLLNSLSLYNCSFHSQILVIFPLLLLLISLQYQSLPTNKNTRTHTRTHASLPSLLLHLRVIRRSNRQNMIPTIIPLVSTTNTQLVYVDIPLQTHILKLTQPLEPHPLHLLLNKSPNHRPMPPRGHSITLSNLSNRRPTHRGHHALHNPR